jgi:hypothetical protein
MSGANEASGIGVFSYHRAGLKNYGTGRNLNLYLCGLQALQAVSLVTSAATNFETELAPLR